MFSLASMAVVSHRKNSKQCPPGGALAPVLAYGAMQELNPHMSLINQHSQAAAQAPAASANPLFDDWSGPFGVPPFGQVAPQHFLPAFARAFAAHEAEVAAIAADAAEPTFANTIDALETAGDALTRASNVLLSPRRGAHERRDPGGGARTGAARGQALEPDPHGRGPVPPDRCASSPARRSSA